MKQTFENIVTIVLWICVGVLATTLVIGLSYEPRQAPKYYQTPDCPCKCPCDNNDFCTCKDCKCETCLSKIEPVGDFDLACAIAGAKGYHFISVWIDKTPFRPPLRVSYNEDGKEKRGVLAEVQAVVKGPWRGLVGPAVSEWGLTKNKEGKYVLDNWRIIQFEYKDGKWAILEPAAKEP